MNSMYGFRFAETQAAATSGTFKSPAHRIDVTNTSGSTANITLNPALQAGTAGDGGMMVSGMPKVKIPVPTGTTKEIDMLVYDWSSDQTVTVVGYVP